MKTVLIIGGTGAQGAEITRFLSSTNQYHLLVLTRNTTSTHATELGALPNVELVASEAEKGYNLEVFFKQAARSDYAFINTDGFAVGEQAETYWGIRMFELCQRAGVKHFVYSGLDYNGKKSNYDPQFYVGHYEGKARVQEFIHAQGKGQMAWSIIRSGPYIEMLTELFLPRIAADGKYQFHFPLGEGAVPFVHLGDFARYVHWIFSNPDASAGLDFGMAIAHVTGQEVADAFTAKTGNPAEYVDIPIDVWLDNTFGRFPKGKNTKVGYLSVSDDSALVLTYAENFTNWWNLYKASAGNTGLITRDYEQLDKILPGRVRSVREWMEKTGYQGERKPLLKKTADYELGS